MNTAAQLGLARGHRRRWDAFAVVVALVAGFVSLGSVRQAAEAGVPFTSGMVSIVFDDNDKSQFEIAKPELDRRGWKATFYVHAGLLEEANPCCITATQFRTLWQAGHQLAAHTVSHEPLLAISDHAARIDQLVRGPQIITQLTGAPAAQDFATPFGYYDPTTLGEIKQYYRSQRGISAGVNYKDTDPFELASVLVDRDRKLDFVQPFLNKARDRRGWMILTMHDIAATQGPAGGIYQNQITTAYFIQLMDAIAASGLRVVTVGQAMAEMGPKQAPLPGRVIYQDDVIQTGYLNFSYGVHDLSSTEQAHSGTSSIMLEPDGFSGIQLFHPNTPAADYEALEFWINGGATGGQTLFVKVSDYTPSVPVVERSVADILGGPIQANTWQKVRVAVPASQHLNILKISTGDNFQPDQPKVFIDDIVLIPKSNTPTSTTTTTLGGTTGVQKTGAITPVGPSRLLDSRPTGVTVDGQNQAVGVRPAGQVYELQVTGRAGVPADAIAAVLNVTVTSPEAAGYVTLFPCGAPLPNASTVNFNAGDTVANLSITRLGTPGGKVCLYSSVATHVIVDVNAYFPGGASYSSIPPVRILDSRPNSTTVDGQSQAIGKLANNQTVELQIGGRAGVPANAGAVALNVTDVEATDGGYVTVYPCGTRPNASNLNFNAGQAVANLAVVKLDATGKVCLFTSTSSHLIVDLSGFYPAAAAFAPLTPSRLLDTRPGATTADGQGQAGGKLAAGQEIQVVVSGRLGIPAGALTAMLNITVADPGGSGYLTVYPCGTARPNSSNLNHGAGQTIANSVAARIGGGGRVCIYTFAATHLIVDTPLAAQLQMVTCTGGRNRVAGTLPSTLRMACMASGVPRNRRNFATMGDTRARGSDETCHNNWIGVSITGSTTSELLVMLGWARYSTAAAMPMPCPAAASADDGLENTFT